MKTGWAAARCFHYSRKRHQTHWAAICSSSRECYASCYWHYSIIIMRGERWWMIGYLLESGAASRWCLDLIEEIEAGGKGNGVPKSVHANITRTKNKKRYTTHQHHGTNQANRPQIHRRQSSPQAGEYSFI